jgi:hypothetical protein
MDKQMNTVFKVLLLQQVSLELLENLNEGNIFRENNYDQVDSFIKYLESNVEMLTEGMGVQESDSYIYITNRIRKTIERIKLT